MCLFELVKCHQTTRPLELFSGDILYISILLIKTIISASTTALPLSALENDATRAAPIDGWDHKLELKSCGTF